MARIGHHISGRELIFWLRPRVVNQDGDIKDMSVGKSWQ